MAYEDWPIGAIVGYFVVFFVIVFFAIFGGIWADPQLAIRAAENQGFSQVRIVDKSWFAVSFKGCSNSDAAKFSIKAINPSGKEVEMSVCVGWPFKGATLRSN